MCMPTRWVWICAGYVQVIDAKNCIICPGFIDIQINGAFGVDFSDPNLTEEEMKKVRRNLLSVHMPVSFHS